MVTLYLIIMELEIYIAPSSSYSIHKSQMKFVEIISLVIVIFWPAIYLLI